MKYKHLKLEWTAYPNSEDYIVKDNNNTTIGFLAPKILIENSNDWQPIIEKVKLFTTIDGIDIYNEDKYYFIDKNLNEISRICYFPSATSSSDKDLAFIYFSTKDAAKDYILHNKPLFSLDDIENIFSDDFYKNKVLTNLEKNAKQKLGYT